MKPYQFVLVAAFTTVLVVLTAWNRARPSASAAVPAAGAALEEDAERDSAGPPEPPQPDPAPGIDPRAAQAKVPQIQVVRLPRDTTAVDDELARLLRTTKVQLPEGELTLGEAVAVVEAAVGHQVMWGVLTDRSLPLDLRFRRDRPLQAASLLDMIGPAVASTGQRTPVFEIAPRGGALRCLQLDPPPGVDLERLLARTQFRLECTDAPLQQVKEFLEESLGLYLAGRFPDDVTLSGSITSGGELMQGLRATHGLVWPFRRGGGAIVHSRPMWDGSPPPETEAELRQRLDSVRVSIDLQEMPLARAARLLFTEIAGAPVQLSERARAEGVRCTLSVTSLSGSQVLAITLQLHDLGWHWEGDGVVVTTKQEASERAGVSLGETLRENEITLAGAMSLRTRDACGVVANVTGIQITVRARGLDESKPLRFPRDAITCERVLELVCEQRGLRIEYTPQGIWLVQD